MNSIQGVNTSLNISNFEDKINYNFEKEIHQILITNNENKFDFRKPCFEVQNSKTFFWKQII